MSNPVDDFNARELAAGRLTLGHLRELAARFQAAEGMPADGKIGPRTRAMLELLKGRESSPAAPAPRAAPTLPITPREMPALTIGDGLLFGAGVQLELIHPSRYYKHLDTPDGRPAAIVAHYTATDPGTAIGMARRMVGPLAPGDRQVSWHISIEADGLIVQQAPLTVGCWHAGGKTALPIAGVGTANRVAVGIELVGHGRLFPAAQVDAACRVWRALVRGYSIPREHAMVGHSEIDPTRKVDPGPVWTSQHASRVLTYAFQ